MAFGLAALLSLATACGRAPGSLDDAGHTRDASASTDAAWDAEPDATGGAGARRELRILFIGNSYTFVNDLPSLVRDALASAPELSVEVESVTAGGATLAEHWEAGVALERIRTGDFTHVVVQGQSVEPCDGISDFYEHALRFAEAARAASTRIVFYETWARRAGDPFYTAAAGTPLSTPEGMQACLTSQYANVAWDGMGDLAPIGDAWFRALGTHPALELFTEDGSHPSLAGSWLAASVLVCSIADRSAHGLVSPADLPASDAELLIDVADDACAFVASGGQDGTDGVRSEGCAVGSAIADPGCDEGVPDACVEWVATHSAGRSDHGFMTPPVIGGVAACAYTDRVENSRCRRADECTGSVCTCGGGAECADDQMCARDDPESPFRCVCIEPARLGPI